MGCRRNKARGALAELQVATKVRSLGGEISFPHGDTAAYDLICDFGGRTSRIQVKSSMYTKGATYDVHVTHNQNTKIYDKGECDYVVVVVPYGTYVIPVEEIEHKKLIFWEPGTHRLSARKRECDHEKRREDWRQLM